MFKSSENLLMRFVTEIDYLNDPIGISTGTEDDDYEDDDYEDKSYQLVVSVIAEEKEKNDGSLTKEQFDKIEDMLGDTSINLSDAYYNILNFLNDICHSEIT